MPSLDFPPVHDVENKALGHLRPLTPSNRGRYDKAFDPSLRFVNLTIPAGLDLEDPLPQLPDGWLCFVHPEGQPYFLRYGNGILQVLTESWIKDAGVLTKLGPYVEEIERLLLEMGIEMTDTLELYIQLEEEGCGYYLVEHSMRTMFWLHDQTIDDLDLSVVTSKIALNAQIEGLYCTHVENFPSHFDGSNVLGHEWIEDLVRVFAYGRADQLTSRDSTFPYSVEECGQILELLKDSKDDIASGYIICLSARLWAFIWHDRVLNFYGTQHARIGRFQAVELDPATQCRWMTVLGRMLSFNLVARYLSTIAGCIRDWAAAKQAASMTFLFHIFFFLLDADAEVATVSAVLLVASFVTATALIYSYEPLEDMTADEAATYLDTIYSPTLKFQLVALTFSLPGALNLWGLLAVLVNCGIVFTRSFGIHSAIALFAACGLVMFLFLWTTSAVFKSRLIECFTDVTSFSSADDKNTRAEDRVWRTVKK
ncbi:hypothetical protein DFH06DRAFT_1324512 [Mycena polygramma]|nr:hypothetical protein DFH06DRAFT_1324512 [Mycena polygramma]